MNIVDKTRAELIIMDIRAKAISHASKLLDVPQDTLDNVIRILDRTKPKLVVPVKYSQSGLTRTLIARYGRTKAHIIARGMYGYGIIKG